MPVYNWPASLPQFPRREAWTGGPQDTRAKFEPDVGPPIVRRRVTEDAEIYDGQFRNLKGAQMATLRGFVKATLKGGALSYSWRDPVYGDAALWRLLGSGERLYDVTARGADLHDVAVRLMRLPGSPWWGIYLRPSASVVPYVVADWTAGIYGIDGVKVLASALTALAGTFDVYSTSTADVETVALAQVITPGGIPATAPGSVKRRVYFAP